MVRRTESLTAGCWFAATLCVKCTSREVVGSILCGIGKGTTEESSVCFCVDALVVVEETDMVSFLLPLVVLVRGFWCWCGIVAGLASGVAGRSALRLALRLERAGMVTVVLLGKLGEYLCYNFDGLRLAGLGSGIGRIVWCGGRNPDGERLV